MQINSEGSVRVDLVGGTLDIEPINLILPNVVTLNVATSLKAKVKIEKNDTNELIIISKDYDKNYSYEMSDLTEENFVNDQFFKEMNFVAQVVSTFSFSFGLTIELSSGAPAGSGLGGSSAMAITLYKALLDLNKEKLSHHEIVKRVKNIEARILRKGVPGYQDYYPALTGGILSLFGNYQGINFEQLYTKELKDFLENNLVLVYSGISRYSGINNWEVYKAFFDEDPKVTNGLNEIAAISYDCLNAIKNKQFAKIPDLIVKEGKLRESLFDNIVPNEVKSLSQELCESNLAAGIKMCGAGGGGCFLIITSRREETLDIIKKHKMQVLPFLIEAPINE